MVESLELSGVLPCGTGVSGVGLMLSLFSDVGLKTASERLLLWVILLLIWSTDRLRYLTAASQDRQHPREEV